MAKLLIVDDSSFARSLIAKLVEKFGHDVVAQAADGFEGVELFRVHNPDLVILDVTMPNRDGLETLKEIIHHQPSAKVVMVSSVKNQDMITRCLEAGALDFIEKQSALKNVNPDGPLSKILTEL